MKIPYYSWVVGNRASAHCLNYYTQTQQQNEHTQPDKQPSKTIIMHVKDTDNMTCSVQEYTNGKLNTASV